MFFSGELDREIKRLDMYLKSDPPEEVYNPLNSVSYVKTSSTTNNISDKTGQAVVKLENEKEQARYTLGKLKALKHDIELIINIKKKYNLINNDDIKIFKRKITTKTSFKQVARFYGISRYKAKKIYKRLLQIFQKHLAR